MAGHELPQRLRPREQALPGRCAASTSSGHPGAQARAATAPRSRVRPPARRRARPERRFRTLSAAAIPTSSACVSGEHRANANTIGARTNATISSVNSTAVALDPTCGTHRVAESPVQRPARDRSHASGEQRLDEAVHDPRRRNDERRPVQPSRRQLDVHAFAPMSIAHGIDARRPGPHKS